MAINKKLIYFASKNKFTEQSANLLNTSIVFIGDTQEIWTHGVFFNTKWDNISNKPTTLSGYGITDAARKIDSLYYVEGNTTGTAGAWTGTISEITELYTGLTIAYKIGVAGASTTNLNINNLGNKLVRRNTSNLTTHLPVGSVAILTYDGTYWVWADYDSDSNTYDRTYWGNTITAGAPIYSYKLLMQGLDGKFYPLTLETGTGTTKTVAIQEFEINSQILHYATTATVAANGTATNVYSEIPITTLSYTANQASWTSQQLIYLKGTILPNGNFKLDNTSYTSFMTQTLPTTADGFVYVLLGYMYSTTAMRLFQFHPMYEYRDGALRTYMPMHSHGNITDGGAIGSVANKPIITGTGGVLQVGSFGTSANTFAEGNHTHSQYLESITKAHVEAVLTGNITTHTHSYLPLAGGTVAGQINLTTTTITTPQANTIALAAKSDGLYQKLSTGVESKLSIDGHTHSYLPLIGGTLTGDTTFNTNIIANNGIKHFNSDGTVFDTIAIKNNASIPSGYIKFVTPIKAAINQMFSIDIVGYDYSVGKSIDFTVVGYAYSGTDSVINIGFSNRSSFNKQVRVVLEDRGLGYRQMVIALGADDGSGTSSQTWYFQKFSATIRLWGGGATIYNTSDFSWVNGETALSTGYWQSSNINNQWLDGEVGSINTSGIVTATTANFTNLTTSYLPKQTASGLANSIIYDDGTNVGIGVTSLAEKLNIAGNIYLTDATTSTIRANKELVLRQDGDEHGSSILRLKNRYGENGVVFESTHPTTTIVDFQFKTAANQRAIRLEGRSDDSAKAGTPSFHIGGTNIDQPSLAVGDTYVAVKDRLSVGSYSYHAYTLNVAGTFNASISATSPKFDLGNGWDIRAVSDKLQFCKYNTEQAELTPSGFYLLSNISRGLFGGPSNSPIAAFDPNTALYYYAGAQVTMSTGGNITATSFKTNTGTADQLLVANGTVINKSELAAYAAETITNPSGTLTLKLATETVITNTLTSSNSISISLPSPTSGRVNESILIFKIGASLPTITQPSGIVYRILLPSLVINSTWTFVYEQVWNGSSWEIYCSSAKNV